MRYVFLFILALSLVAAQECIPTDQRGDSCEPLINCGCGGTLNQHWETDNCPAGQGYCVQDTQCTATNTELICTDGQDDDCNGLIDCQESSCAANSYCIDLDNDGEPKSLDCDDNNPNVNSKKAELCNQIDDNCNGQIDEIFNLNNDVNNCGSCNNKIQFNHAIPICQNGIGTFSQCIQGYYDLDNNQANGCEYTCTNTGAEICDGKDNNCDGKIDENLNCEEVVIEDPIPIVKESNDSKTPPITKPIAVSSNCIDLDKDGFGENCPLTGDCNDNNNQIYPGAKEQCNNLDDNCNNIIDEDLQRSCGTNIGICEIGVETCQEGNWLGCTAKKPLLKEICYDNLDNTCNGKVDEGCLKLNQKEQLLRSLKPETFESAIQTNKAQEGIFYHIETDSKIKGGKTRIEISIVPHEKNLKGVTIYHQIDKQAVQSTDEITFLHSNNIRLEIIEKDPLIAWHITETSDKTSIAYELDKEIEEVEKHLTTVTEVGEISENSDSKFVAILPLLLIPILGVTLIGFARFARKK